MDAMGRVRLVPISGMTIQKHRDTADILNVLQNGANAAAMPAWKSKLSTNEIILVSAYVASLRGTSDGSGKPAEGQEIPPWPKADPSRCCG